jgi:hypothetical protein
MDAPLGQCYSTPINYTFMNRKLFWAVLIVLIIGVAATAAVLHKPQPQGVRLPEQRPVGLNIWYNYGAGMIPQGSSLFISEDQSYVESYSNGSKRKNAFTVTPQELDALYAQFKNHGFDRITQRQEEVYDAPAGGIGLSWSGLTVHQNLDGGVVMSERDAAALTAINEALQSFVSKKLDALRVPVTIVADKTIPDLAALSVYLDNGPDLHLSNTTTPARTYVGRVLPGQLSLMASYQSPSIPANKSENYFLQKVVVVPTTTGAVITLRITNQALGYTVR